MTAMHQALAGSGPPAVMEHGGMKFLITYMPDKNRSHRYIQDLLKHNTRKLLNVTDKFYCKDHFTTVGIAVEELFIPDGSFPKPEVIDQWLKLVRQHFSSSPGTTLAVHDHSGLGRSAVLVAIALMELGLKPLEAIAMIREKRKGAFNPAQFDQLGKYKAKNRLKEKTRFFFGRWRKRSTPTPTPTPNPTPTPGPSTSK